MRKTIIILLAAVLFLLTAVPCACAEGKDTAGTEAPRVYIMNDSEEREWAEILGFSKPLENIQTSRSYPSLADLLRECQPDFFEIYTYQYGSPRDLYLDGLIEPFEPTEAMTAEIESMAPYVRTAIRNELMTPDGKMLGYPSTDYSICEAPEFIGYWIPDAWAASPFRETAPPSSFEELLDFIDVYLDTPHNGFRLSYAGSKNEYLHQLLLDLLMVSWVVQCRYAGEPTVFSDPKFIELACRTQELFRKLLKEDYRKNVDTSKRYLFAWRQLGGLSFNGEDTFTCANMIPLRITADQPPLINLNMKVYCTRQGTPYASHSGELFETAIKTHVLKRKEATIYDVWAFPLKPDLDAVNRYLEKEKAPKYCGNTHEWAESVETLDRYAVPCMECSDYIIGTQYAEFMKAKYDFFMKAEMTAEEFAAELDREYAAAKDDPWDKHIWITDYN